MLMCPIAEATFTGRRGRKLKSFVERSAAQLTGISRLRAVMDRALLATVRRNPHLTRRIFKRVRA